MRRVVLVVVLAVLVLAGVTAPVSAHAYLAESDPDNGEQLEGVPAEVELTFSGDGVQVADVTVTDPDGEDISGEARVDPDDSQRVTAPLEPGGEGLYLVEWEVLADDGHTTSGTTFFTVGDEPADPEAIAAAYEDDDEGTIEPLEAAAGGLIAVGLAGLVGIPVTVRRVIDETCGEGRGDGRLLPALAGLSVVTAVGVVALGLARSTAFGALSTAGLTAFLETSLGTLWVGQLALAVALVCFTAVGAWGPLSRRWVYLGTGLGAVGLAGTLSWTSHSGTTVGRLSGGAVDLAHVLGSGLWIGGLLALALALPIALEEADDARSVATASLRRFSTIALAGVTLLVASGLVLASWHAPASAGLTETVYGRLLLLKVSLGLSAIVLGGVMRFVTLPRLGAGDTSIRNALRGVRVEVVVLVVVLVLSGLVTAAPPAAVAHDDGPAEATWTFGDEATVTADLLPATEDADWLVVDEGDPLLVQVGLERDGDPVESDQPVRLLATTVGGDVTIDVELERTGTGEYATVQTLPEAGVWELRLSAAPGGEFVSDWHDLHVEHDHGHDHGDHDHDEDDDHDHDEGGDLVVPLRVGAGLVAVVGALAVVREYRE